MLRLWDINTVALNYTFHFYSVNEPIKVWIIKSKGLKKVWGTAAFIVSKLIHVLKESGAGSALKQQQQKKPLMLQVWEF